MPVPDTCRGLATMHGAKPFSNCNSIYYIDYSSMWGPPPPPMSAPHPGPAAKPSDASQTMQAVGALPVKGAGWYWVLYKVPGPPTTGDGRCGGRQAIQQQLELEHGSTLPSARVPR